jgi:ATP-dependent Clp protease ATP-binding subunit ClpA
MTDFGLYRERFAESGLHVLECAVNESRRRQQNYLSLGHILKALLTEEPVTFNQTFTDLHIDPPLTEEFLDMVIASSPNHKGVGIRISPQVTWLFRNAIKVARSDGRERIESVDLLSGFVRGLKAGAPWLGERKNAARIGLAFIPASQPYFYVIRL